MSLSFATMASIRFGYGFRPGQTPPASVEEMLDQLDAGIAQPPLFPENGIAARRQEIAEFRARYKNLQSKKKTLPPDDYHSEQKLIRKAITDVGLSDKRDRLIQASESSLGFFERLSTFWVDHFSVSTAKTAIMQVVVPLYEADAIRPNMGSNFRNLLQSAILHPAMVIYLDQDKSTGPHSKKAEEKKKGGLNENLGRELIELHTMGAGSGYGQTDVRNAAYVLTGLRISADCNSVTFDEGYSEPGKHKVLDGVYGGDRRSIDDIVAMLDDLANRPETARYICRKLVVHFVSDDPPTPIIDAMTTAWSSTDGDLKSVYKAMLDHPDSWKNEGAKAKQPFDFIVSALRALDVPVQALMQGPETGENNAGKQDMVDVGDMAGGADMASPADGKARNSKKKQNAGTIAMQSIRKLGQPVWQPSSPAGWNEAFEVWVSAGQLTERIAFVRRLAALFKSDADPRQFLNAALADAARDDTIRVVERAPSKQSGVMLALASPEFNRR